MGRPLPFPLDSGIVVPNGEDSFLIVGGRTAFMTSPSYYIEMTDKIIQFDAATMGWTVRQERMSNAVQHPFVIGVDEEIYCSS